MVYTDGVHLITDGEIEELHKFAQKIGLKREWFQNKKKPHYDLFGGKRQKAVKAGAIVVSSREIIKILRDK
ncbi:MAG: DUF4031 domain-containing protein [bacterium]